MPQNVRLNQNVRLLRLDRQIRDGMFPNAQGFAAQCDCTSRQVHYDRKRLIEMGAPLRWNAKHKGWFYADATWSLPAVYLNEGELLAFFLAVEIARGSGNPGLQSVLLSAAAKISNSLTDRVSVDLNALRDGTSYHLSPAARVESEIYLQLHRAAAARRKVRARYFTATRGQWSERTLHPYHLHFARGEWILIAHDENRAQVRCFNIARIENLRDLTEHFARDLEFDATEYVAEMFVAERGEQVVEVAVQFDEYQARYIRERSFHPNQKPLEEQPDGGLILRFPASGLNEIARWIMGYGAHARALEPPELRAIIAGHVEKMGQIYGEKTE